MSPPKLRSCRSSVWEVFHVPIHLTQVIRSQPSSIYGVWVAELVDGKESFRRIRYNVAQEEVAGGLSLSGRTVTVDYSYTQ